MNRKIEKTCYTNAIKWLCNNSIPVSIELFGNLLIENATIVDFDESFLIVEIEIKNEIKSNGKSKSKDKNKNKKGNSDLRIRKLLRVDSIILLEWENGGLNG